MRNISQYRTFASFLMSLTLGFYVRRHWAFPDDKRRATHGSFAKAVSVLCHQVRFSTLMLFTTPFFIASVIFSLAYIFEVLGESEIGTQRLPKYPDPRQRKRTVSRGRRTPSSQTSGTCRTSALAHHPGSWPVHRHCDLRKPCSGKTTGCMYPFADQVLAYRARTPSAVPPP